MLHTLAGGHGVCFNVGWLCPETLTDHSQVIAGAPEALRNIAKLGFDASHFAGVVTSGEVAHRQLEQRPTAFWQQLGRRWA